MWLRRIFSIGENDLSSRTFHRNIEYDKIISRHPSLPAPPPLRRRRPSPNAQNDPRFAVESVTAVLNVPHRADKLLYRRDVASSFCPAERKHPFLRRDARDSDSIHCHGVISLRREPVWSAHKKG